MHFTQCIFKRIQSDGLKGRYGTDANFAVKLRLLFATKFVPATYVVDAFEALYEQDVHLQNPTLLMIILRIPESGVLKEVDDVVCLYFGMIYGRYNGVQENFKK